MTERRIKELAEQIKDDTLPPLTVENIMGTLGYLAGRVNMLLGTVSYRYPFRITMHAHRMALIIAGVRIPSEHDALHKCNIRACVRVHPKHVYHGTVSRNMLDRVEHGTDPHRRLTHCLRGHLFDKENTMLLHGGRHRVCRACAKLSRGPLKGSANKRKTHCPQGHPYDEENTFITKTGGRRCKNCMAIWANARVLGTGNKFKTHCPAEHPYNEINTRVTVVSGRQCRICDKLRHRKEG